jgi:uncharacterized protein YkwD
MLNKKSLMILVLLLTLLMVGCGGLSGQGDKIILIAPPLSGEGDAPDEQTRFTAISVSSQLGATAGGSGSFSVNSGAPEAMAQAINEKRCEAGLTPIAANALLNQAAEAHSRYLANDATLNSDGDPGAMISSTGYVRTGGWQLLMCGGPTDDAQAYFDNWWNNGYQDTFLSNYQEIGVGLITDETGFSYISVFFTSPASGITLPSCSDLGF